MGLIEQEIKELRAMNKQFDDGHLSAKAVHTKIAIYSQTEKRARLIIQALTLRAKYGKRIADVAHKKNLIGDEAAIEILNIDSEDEKIMCPTKDETLITRAECLDYSGSHMEECSSCSNDNTTRKILLDP